MDGTPVEEQLVGGELNAAIARNVVRARREYAGRGPTRAQAFHRQNVVVVILYDAMTKAEHSLVTAGQDDLVLQLRMQLQEAMRAELVSVIEGTTGCHVVTFV